MAEDPGRTEHRPRLGRGLAALLGASQDDSDAPGARCCLVTIESIKTSPYVAKLHELLGRQSTVYDIVFTERLKLFPDAKWQDNVVFTFGRGQPTPDTVTTRDRFGLIVPERGGLDILFRMLQPHELAGAMGFEPEYKFCGSRENRVKQIGNAWPNALAEALCREILRG